MERDKKNVVVFEKVTQAVGEGYTMKQCRKTFEKLKAIYKSECSKSGET